VQVDGRTLSFVGVGQESETMRTRHNAGKHPKQDETELDRAKEVRQESCM